MTPDSARSARVGSAPAAVRKVSWCSVSFMNRMNSAARAGFLLSLNAAMYLPPGNPPHSASQAFGATAHSNSAFWSMSPTFQVPDR